MLKDNHLRSLKPSTFKRIWMTSVLEIKVSCSDMPPTNGTRKPSTPTLTTCLTSSVKRWLRLDTQELFHGWDQIANHKLLLNTSKKESKSNQSESTIYWSLLNTTQKYLTKKSTKFLLNKLLRKSAQQNFLSTLNSLSTHLVHSFSEDPLQIQDWPEERSSLIPMVVGPHTEVVLSQERTPPRSTDQLATMPDMSPSPSLPLVSATESSSKSPTLSASQTHSPSMLTHTVQSRTVWPTKTWWLLLRRTSTSDQATSLRN